MGQAERLDVDMSSRPCTPGLVWALADEEGWDSHARQAALTLATAPPGLEAWRLFLERVLLALGALGLLSGVICLVGAHWTSWGRLGQFALVGSLLTLSGGGAVRFGLRTVAGGWALVLASGCLGGLLLLTWEELKLDEESFFTTWAALLFPMAWLSGFAPQWVFWLAVANVASQVILGDNTEALALQGVLNGGFWALAQRFQPRLGWPAVPAWISLLWVTTAAFYNIVGRDEGLGLAAWALVALPALLLAWPRRSRGVLAGVGFSAVVLVTAALARTVSLDGMGTFLFIGMAVVVQVALLLEGLRRLGDRPEAP